MSNTGDGESHNAAKEGEASEASGRQSAVTAAGQAVPVTSAPPPPLPGSETSSKIGFENTGGGSSTPGASEMLGRRRLIGYGVGVIGFGIVATMAMIAFDQLSHEDISMLARLGQGGNKAAVYLFAIKMTGEAIVSIALVFFAYQTLKTAERMVLPPWWVTKENIELLKAMLGIDSPVDGAGRVLKGAADTLQAAAKSVTDTVSAVQGEKKKDDKK